MLVRQYEAKLEDAWRLSFSIVGVDPGKNAAVCWLGYGSDYGKVRFFQIDPWLNRREPALEYFLLGQLESFQTHHRVYIEIPQNGTHASRGGVHFHAGMILGRMVERLSYPKKVSKVTPREWRTVYGPRPKDTDWKALAKQTATYYFPSIPQDFPDDVYEAAMIAVYGLEVELRKQREKKQRKAKSE